MSKVFRFIGKALKTAILATLILALTCNLYLFAKAWVTGEQAPSIWGYSLAVVASGSMEPALYVDDLIVNHAQDGYQLGDIITFRSGNSLTTHRIVGRSEEGWVTQGDANNVADPQAVAFADVVGRVVLRIPYAGGIIFFLKTPLGMSLLILCGFLLMLFSLGLHQRPMQTDEEDS